MKNIIICSFVALFGIIFLLSCEQPKSHDPLTATVKIDCYNLMQGTNTVKITNQDSSEDVYTYDIVDSTANPTTVQTTQEFYTNYTYKVSLSAGDNYTSEDIVFASTSETYKEVSLAEDFGLGPP